MEGSPHNRFFEFTSACFWRGFGGNRLGVAIHPAHICRCFFESLFAAKEPKQPSDKSLQSLPVRNAKKSR